MVKFFIYAYELIHIFIAIHVQALVSQKCFDLVTSGVGNLFTIFRIVRKHDVYFMQMRCRSTSASIHYIRPMAACHAFAVGHT